MPAVSAVIVACNEEKNLGRCLESVSWVDELIVVDSGSSDRTSDIARSCGARVYHHPWHRYMKQIDFALSKASCEWVVSLDADEEFEPELIEEIRDAIENVDDGVEGLNMPRKCFYLGKWIHHGEWYPDRKMRAFRRLKAQVGGGGPHGFFVVQGAVHELKGHILHYSFDDVEDHVRRMNRYSTVMAQDLYEKGVRFSLWTMLGETLLRGVRNYVVRGGMRDGVRGLIITVILMYYVFLQHAKLFAYQLAGQGGKAQRQGDHDNASAG